MPRLKQHILLLVPRRAAAKPQKPVWRAASPAPSPHRPPLPNLRFHRHGRLFSRSCRRCASPQAEIRRRRGRTRPAHSGPNASSSLDSAGAVIVGGGTPQENSRRPPSPQNAAIGRRPCQPAPSGRWPPGVIIPRPQDCRSPSATVVSKRGLPVSVASAADLPVGAVVAQPSRVSPPRPPWRILRRRRRPSQRVSTGVAAYRPQHATEPSTRNPHDRSPRRGDRGERPFEDASFWPC